MKKGLIVGVGFILILNLFFVSAAVCGNNLIDHWAETCDGTDLNENTCETVLGEGATGTLACSEYCIKFDTSDCVVPISSICFDSDGGINYYVEGSVKFPLGEGTRFNLDFCDNSAILNESYCEGEAPKTILRDCGMENKACIKGACRSLSYIEPEEDPLEIPEDTEETIYACNGCELESKCYFFGFRKAGSYCSDLEESFVEQKDKEADCENNFECKSNLCIDNQCIEQGFFRKIINWFKRIF